MQQLQTLHELNLQNQYFSPDEIYHIISGVIRRRNDLPQTICPHNIEINLENNNITIQFLNGVICDCFQEITPFNRQLVFLLLYFLDNQNQYQRNYDQMFENIENNFEFYEIYSRAEESQKLKNLRNLQQFAQRLNCDRVVLSYRILDFQQYSLKIVDLYNGIIIGQQLGNFRQTSYGYFQLLQFFSLAEENRLILNSICPHNINLGPQKLINDQLCFILQSSQVRCGVCQNDDLCSCFGILGQHLQQIEQSTFDFNFLFILEELAQGQIRPLSFVNQILNPNYIDEVQEFEIREFPLVQVLMSRNIRQQLTVQTQIYKIYFVQITLAQILMFLLENNLIQNLVNIFQIFQLLIKKLIDEMQITINGIQNVDFSLMLDQYSISQIDQANQQELNNYNRSFQNTELNFYPERMENFDFAQYQNQILIYQFPSLIEYRIKCCFVIESYFLNILQNLQPYLEATNFQHGYQFYYFEQYIKDPYNENVVNQILDTLNQNYANRFQQHM